MMNKLSELISEIETTEKLATVTYDDLLKAVSALPPLGTIPTFDYEYQSTGTVEDKTEPQWNMLYSPHMPLITNVRSCGILPVVGA